MKRLPFLRAFLAIVAPLGSVWGQPGCTQSAAPQTTGVVPAEEALPSNASASQSGAPSPSQALSPRPAATEASAGATIHVTPQAAIAGGLPPLALRLDGVWGGFTRSTRPHAGTYLSLAGPPGQLLMLVVKPHEPLPPTAATLDRAFRRWARGLPRAEPVVAAEPERITLQGVDRVARAYRVGGGRSAANWCVVAVPVGADSRRAALVLLGVGVADDSRPRCGASTEHPRLAPLIASLRVE